VCREGIKIGRKADVQSARVSVATATNVQLLKGDGNRIGVALAALIGGNWTITESIVVGPLVSGVVVPVVTLSQYQPAAYLSVEKFGSVLFQPLYALSNVGTTEVIGVTDVRFLHSLDDL
jgi:hypothetical protein